MACIYITGSADGLGRATAHTLLGEVRARFALGSASD